MGKIVVVSKLPMMIINTCILNSTLLGLYIIQSSAVYNILATIDIFLTLSIIALMPPFIQSHVITKFIKI